MTKYVVAAVRDRAADVFGIPFFSPTVGTAIRSFNDAVNSPEPSNQLRAHPEDFDLYQLGTYEDHHGLFEMLAQPHQIAIGKDAIRPSPSGPAA